MIFIPPEQMIYEDDVPAENPLRTSEAETSEGPTGIPLSGPLNDTSPLGSVSGPHAEREISEEVGPINGQNPCPEQVLEDVAELSTTERTQDDTLVVPTQDLQPSAQSKNIPVPTEEISNDQPHRITKWTRSHP